MGIPSILIKVLKMSDRNKMRIEESRTMETRVADRNFDEIRKNILMDAKSTLDLPEHMIPPGLVYQWIRETIHKTGENPDVNRMPTVERVGWRAVPSSRHPELAPRDIFDRNPHLRGYIYKDGLILCDRPKELHEIEMSKYNNDTQMALKHVNRFDKDLRHIQINDINQQQWQTYG